MKEKIKIEKTGIILTILIFEKREVKILESSIVYLKERGMKYSEIGELLERDQRHSPRRVSQRHRCSGPVG